MGLAVEMNMWIVQHLLENEELMLGALSEKSRLDCSSCLM